MLAVVGAGSWGKNHVRSFAELGALSAVCDTDEAALGNVRGTYPGVKTGTDLERVLADPEIKAVVLATPAAQHYAGAKAALAAGKHVLVEKPMTLRAEEAEELNRLALGAGLVLMVGHILEYHPAVRRLRELVVAGELGKLAYLYSHRLSLGKIRMEENVWWDLGPHDVSLILGLLFESPEWVQATGQAMLTPGVADSVVACLGFAGGARAHIFVSRVHPLKEQRLVVGGREKMAVFDDVVSEGKLKVYPSHITGDDQLPVATGGEPEVVPIDAGEPLRAECEHFLECIEAGSQPLTGGESGVQVTRVLEACQRSLDQHGARVRLAEPH